MEGTITHIVKKITFAILFSGVLCLGITVTAKADVFAYQAMGNQQYQLTLATYDAAIAYQQYQATLAVQQYQQAIAMQQYQQTLAAQRNLYLNEQYLNSLIQQRQYFIDAQYNSLINAQQNLGIAQQKVVNQVVMSPPYMYSVYQPVYQPVVVYY